MPRNLEKITEEEKRKVLFEESLKIGHCDGCAYSGSYVCDACGIYKNEKGGVA